MNFKKITKKKIVKFPESSVIGPKVTQNTIVCFRLYNLNLLLDSQSNSLPFHIFSESIRAVNLYQYFQICIPFCTICLFIPVHDLQAPRKEVTLPKFSTYVMDELSRGHAKAVWTKMIDECAYFYTTHLGVQTSEDYKSIGKEMYQQYPDIAHEGNEPWVIIFES